MSTRRHARSPHIAYAPGTMEDERDMHARVRECHERGEYFRPVGAFAATRASGPRRCARGRCLQCHGGAGGARQECRCANGGAGACIVRCPQGAGALPRAGDDQGI